MRRVSQLLAVLWLGMILPLPGCHSNGTAEKKEVELPAWLSEKGSTSPAATTTPEIQLASNSVTAAQLGLHLQPGDQFPMRKIVQQELTQETKTGPQKSYSRLELMLAIMVQEQQDGRTKLGVRYNRVKYQHEVGDDRLIFDSTNPPDPIPMGVVAYRDMVHDGFSFWIGADNQIAEVEGLAEFISRCLRNVPPAHRQDVILGIEATSGESGLANFVDNTIGLLPCGTETSPGDSWERQQQLSRPIPMFINNQFTLKELTQQLAVIDIHGTITPSLTLKSGETSDGVNIVVNGGNTIGSCTIYRDTGLPKESRIDRFMDMTITMPEYGQFHQSKRVTTMIESFPVTSASMVSRKGAAAPPESVQPLPAPDRSPRNGDIPPTALQRTITR